MSDVDREEEIRPAQESLILIATASVDIRTNRTNGLEEGIGAWDDPIHPLNREKMGLRRTPFGNINYNGTPGDYRGYMLPRYHPDFLESIEPGVRSMVQAIVNRGWITYFSCEGHYYAGKSLDPLKDTWASFLGLIKNTEKVIWEFEAIRSQLEIAQLQPLHISIRRMYLDTGNDRRDTVELWIERDPAASWREYFQHLNDFSSVVVMFLTEHAVRQVLKQ